MVVGLARSSLSFSPSKRWRLAPVSAHNVRGLSLDSILLYASKLRLKRGGSKMSEQQPVAVRYYFR